MRVRVIKSGSFKPSIRFTILYLFWSLAFVIIILTSTFAEVNLDSNQPSPSNSFRIYYTTDCTNYPSDCVTDTNVNDLGVQLDDILFRFIDPLGNFQFNNPVPNGNFTIQILDLDVTGEAFHDAINFDPGIFVTPLKLKDVALHELFHVVNYTYGGFGWWSAFAYEGIATMMEDKVYLDLDQNDNSNYSGRTRGFLEATDLSLIDLKYSACLFWTYFTEQYGGVSAEPERGVDAIRILLEHYGDGKDDIQRLNATLNDLAPGTSFHDVFMDFIVANYAKDLTDSSVPKIYKYIDDDQTSGGYPRPHLTAGRDMDVGDVFSATDRIRPWAARYYEIYPSPNVPIISVEFHQSILEAGVTLAYNLLVIKDNDLVMDVSEFNVIGRDFVRSIVNRDFDQVAVIVGSLDYPAIFRYTFSTGGGFPTLNILQPLTKYSVAKVDINDLNSFQVHLEVVGPGGAVSGLEPDDFQVWVGATRINIVTGAEVMGQYWLVVQPTALAMLLPDTYYDLKVNLVSGISSDTKSKAVFVCQQMPNTDKMIVTDRSGSMLEPNWDGPYWEEPDPTDKIYGAIDGAIINVNSCRSGDMIGLVWFSHDAKTASSLQNFNETTRVELINHLGNFDQDEEGAWLDTSIGDGLWNAQDELDKMGNPNHNWSIVLLSDGLENEKKYISDVVCDECKIDYLDSSSDHDKPKTKIYTVALGSNADREKLEKLAQDSGGKFRYVMEPHSGDLSNELVSVYRLFAEEDNREQRTITRRGKYSISQSPIIEFISVENGATEATFVINCNWRENVGHIHESSKVTLTDPSGSALYDPLYEYDNNLFLFRVVLPQSGLWTVKLERGPGTEFWGGRYLIEAAVKSKAILGLYLNSRLEERLIGTPLPILAFFTDTHPITGADIQLEITTPEIVGALLIIPSEVDTMCLYDDGRHGDGKADDGVYGGTYYNTNREGIYNLKAIATGYSALLTDNLRRETELAFNVKGDLDIDQDGLPDKWEELHGLDPYNGIEEHGAEGDPDGDGLKNREEFDLGTDPVDSDSDDGGEDDGSESSGGRDPRHPDDDVVQPPTSLRVIPGINCATLIIGYLPEHDYLIVYRGTSLNGPWESFNIAPTGQYTDSGLENDVTYFYKVVGVNTTVLFLDDILNIPIYILTSKSASTRIVSAMPKLDPIPPSGSIIINSGDTITNTEQVTLEIQADSDTKEMKISNNSRLTDAEWEPFREIREWTLLPGGGMRTVYVLFKDTAENIGPRSPLDPSVEIEPAMDSILLNCLHPVEELCDGMDNDCDGQVDEDIIQSCSSLCGTGTEICKNGQWINCNAPQPQVEICDDMDNNCDGKIDEGCPPKITCPDNINKTVLSSGNKAKINYEAEVFDYVNPNPIINYYPPSGSRFSVGTTVVRVTATNSAGMTSECSFTVTVRVRPTKPALEEVCYPYFLGYGYICSYPNSLSLLSSSYYTNFLPYNLSSCYFIPKFENVCYFVPYYQYHYSTYYPFYNQYFFSNLSTFYNQTLAPIGFSYPPILDFSSQYNWFIQE